MSCHGTRCPLLMAFFFFFLSACVTLLPEGSLVGLGNFAWKEGCGRAELAIDKGSVADSRLTSTLVQ